MRFDVVVPTAGRPSLGPLLASLASQAGPAPERVVLIDDGRPGGAVARHVPPALGDRTVVVRSGRERGRGPAAARNAGLRASASPWVALLDDDVVLPPGWTAALAADLEGLAGDVAASQGRLLVPLPQGRRPTDWERQVAGLQDACWATADLCCRRAALSQVGGFDERFPRAFREDADLALRLTGAGHRLVRGERRTLHPVGPAGRWASVRRQAGNADDPFVRRLHGPDWRRWAGAPGGRWPRHAAIAAAGAAAAGLAAAGRPRAALAAAAAWAAGTGELAWARIGPGPRDRDEVLTMIATSAALPFAATAWRLRGVAIASRRAHRPRATPPRAPGAVLLDRDGTLVHDVPYNGDPDRVRPLPGVRAALDRLRDAGVPLAVVSNQSGVARGRLTRAQVDAVNARVEALLGPLGPWLVCPHGPGDGCACRKPAPGLVLAAAGALGVPPEACVVVGDIGADVAAARAAGARAILVPAPVTRRDEVEAAPELAPTLGASVDLLLGAVPDVADDREDAVQEAA